MDSPEKDDGAHKRPCRILLRICFVLLVPFVASCFLTLVIASLDMMIGYFAISSPISVAAQCKIISSGVDIRSSKICELGWLNYKAKHVFYPLERRKFRCHYDYYWASVFKVEYKEHSSGQTHHALAEAPKEALPPDCRPSFGAAWSTKDKFKVNETYNCWYTPGVSKVDIYSDGLFNCQAKDPSLVEMIWRFSVLFRRITDSWPANNGNAKHPYRDSIAGIITGLSTPLIFVSLAKLLHALKFRLIRSWKERKLLPAFYGVYFKRACFLIVYASFMGWLTIQYGKMLGIPKIFMNS
ncbi:uncharacterized protein LOC122646496 [Telopea speciosissima]|uniref:uncharacterized protein LOC122646496 n=1 Tax=Telopea speciosissima TaxID=54955 RepID=UPI001CC598E6|nr:uncharacterized protein LOC122646496 [Telopea speciosissima]